MPISQQPSVSLALDNLRSAYNVGSIFRTADAIGINQLFLLGMTPTPLHPKVAKTALGSQHSTAWTHHCDSVRWAHWYQTSSIPLVALETDNHAPSLYHAILPPKVCFVVGNEVDGISTKLKLFFQNTLTIPQYGHKTSLNVAIAAAMALFSWRRQYPYQPPLS